MKTSIFSICMTLILFGCSKKEEKHRISGIIVSDCETMTPVPDLPLELRFHPDRGFITKPHSFTYTTTTKADGSFVFEFEEKPWSLGDGYEFEGAVIATAPQNSAVTFRQLSGIPPGITDVGYVVRKNPMEYQAVCTIKFENLEVGDSVFFGNSVLIKTAPFTTITDTFPIHRPTSIYGNSYPHYGEKMNSNIGFLIRNNDFEKTIFKELLVDQCETLTLDITISR